MAATLEQTAATIDLRLAVPELALATGDGLRSSARAEVVSNLATVGSNRG